MDQQLLDIRASIVELSGSGKRVAPGARRHGIYSTFTLPGLDDMAAVRNTMTRFRDFGLVLREGDDPEPLRGKTVIDVGSNVGATAFEFCRRGASVVGLEYRDDRVALCNVIARRWELDATFAQVDLNVPLGPRDWGSRRYDIVWSSSVDEYIDDLEPFYEMLHDLCGGVLYLESNLQGKGLSDPENVLAILERSGFVDAVYLGNGNSGGISRKRKLYRARAST